MGQIHVKADLLAKLKEFAKDDDMSPEEIKAMEKAGASEELMEALNTRNVHYDEKTDTVIFTTRKNNEPQPKTENNEKKETDDRPWYKSTLVGIGAGAAVGASIGSIVPGLGTIGGAIVGGVATALTACNFGSDEPNSAADVYNQTIVEVSTTFLMTIEEKTTEINNGNNDEIVALLQTLVDMLHENNKISIENNALLIKILGALTTQNLDNADIKAFLQEALKILNQLATTTGELKEEQKAQRALLNSFLDELKNLGTMLEGNKELFLQLLHVVKEGNAENTELLTAILNQIKIAQNKNRDMSAENKALLQAILDKLSTMDAKTQENFVTIINQLSQGNQINAKILAKLTQVLGKLDKIDENQSKFFAVVVAKFDKLNASQQANLEKFLDAIASNTSAINKNTTVAKATYELVAKLLDKVDELKNNSNVNVDAILEAIANISTGENVDLTTVETLLQQLLQSSEMNNKVLTDIKSKLDAVAVALNGIKLALGEGHEKILQKLEEILNKIPNGCKCDISEILVKLDILIKSIQENPNDDNKHEGILDDLEDLFN